MNWSIFSMFSIGCILSFLGGFHVGANAALRDVKRRLGGKEAE